MISQKKKKKMNPMLIKVIIVSIGLHAIAGLIAGVVTIATHVIQEDALFDEPPAIAEEEPPPEVKVKILPKPQQQPMNQLSMKPVASIAIPQISVDLPSMSDSFTVSAGLGRTGGSLLGGTGGSRVTMKMPEMDFFGAKSKGEKVAFVVHFGPATTTQKGKSTPYTRMTNYVIRKRLEELVSELPAQALFNVTCFWANHCNPFSTKLIPATNPNKQLLLDWMAPVNPVEGSKETYGSSFGKFGGKLSKLTWGKRLDKDIPKYGPAWYYNYVAPKSEVQKYFDPITKEATIHWARSVFWALTTQKPDTIYVLTTNYLPSHADHPKEFAKAYDKICEELYDVAGLKRPTINVVVLANAGSKPAAAERTLERFRPIIHASKGKGTIISDIQKFMTKEEKKRLNSYKKP